MNDKNRATLVLNSEDHPGIVSIISTFLFENGANIISSNHHHEQLDNQFFMRVHFDTTELKISNIEFEEKLKKLAANKSFSISLSFSNQRKKLAIMVSKYDHCLYDLLLRSQYGELNADIALIISNHRDLEHIANTFDIPFFHIPITKETKEGAEVEAIKLLKEFQINFIAMARYMQILSPLIINAFENKIINVHHGFLPAFKGARPYHQAYAGGVKIIGATSHFATADLDMGPIIAQETIKVDHTHDVQSMLAMGRDVEKQVLASAIKAFSEDKIKIYKNRTIIFP